MEKNNEWKLESMDVFVHEDDDNEEDSIKEGDTT